MHLVSRPVKRGDQDLASGSGQKGEGSAHSASDRRVTALQSPGWGTAI
jgi:hypothetical protein